MHFYIVANKYIALLQSFKSAAIFFCKVHEMTSETSFDWFRNKSQ